MDATTLKLKNATFTNACVIGNPGSPGYLTGFEVSDLTIDCNFAGHASSTTKATAAVAVNGKHVFLRGIKVINFGTKDTTVCRVLSAAYSDEALGATEDCVIDTCIVQSPDPTSYGSGDVTCLHLGKKLNTTTGYHVGCVIRNCYVDCTATTKPFKAIHASGGVGTLVEENRILNCQFGGPYQGTNSTIPTKDVVVRGNYYYNVAYGPHLNLPASTPQIGRVVLLENVIELATSGTPIGIKLAGANTNDRFKVAVVRGNVIRHVDGASGPTGTEAIRLNACVEAIAEDNVINIATTNNAVIHDYCQKVKLFNNQSSAGIFLPGYDSLTGLHDWELTNEAEDAFLVR